MKSKWKIFIIKIKYRECERAEQSYSATNV